jgi:hypothetical protein
MKFEYKQRVTNYNKALPTAELDDMGIKGWELVSFIYYASACQFLYIFKRQIK